MIKKIGAVILSLVLIISTMTMSAFAWTGDGTQQAKITVVADKEYVEPGDKVTFTITMELSEDATWKTFGNFLFAFCYNNTILTPTNTTWGPTVVDFAVDKEAALVTNVSTIYSSCTEAEKAAWDAAGINAMARIQCTKDNESTYGPQGYWEPQSTQEVLATVECIVSEDAPVGSPVHFDYYSGLSAKNSFYIQTISPSKANQVKANLYDTTEAKSTVKAGPAPCEKHTPEQDDGDCTTAVKCTVCGTEVVAAKDAHTYEDDGDCTTAVKCTECGKEVTPAAAAHSPAEDDGDCTTAVNCTVCGKEVVAAKDAHTYEDDKDCTTAAYCTVCGKEVVAAKEHVPAEDDNDCETPNYCTVCGKETTAAGGHTPAEDDGDCTTAVNCTVCGKEVTPAAKEHTPAQDDGDCTTAVNCTVCGTEVTPAAAEHTYEDDGDCTTAVNCTVCGKEVTPAAAAHSPAEDDGDCTTAVNCTVCGTEVTPAAAEHTPGQIVIENEVEATCGEAGSYDEVVYCTECGTEISRDTITVDATGEHEYDDGVVTEPTYTSQGYTTYTCTICGDSYDDDFVDALEPEFTFAIREPSITTIRCKDTIVLHAEVNGELPEGATIVWEADNENFSTEELEDGKLEITSQNKGDTVFTATIYDAEGNVLGTDSVEMYSKAGFFGKIGGFFRSLFGSTLYYNY